MYDIGYGLSKMGEGLSGGLLKGTLYNDKKALKIDLGTDRLKQEKELAELANKVKVYSSALSLAKDITKSDGGTPEIGNSAAMTYAQALLPKEKIPEKAFLFSGLKKFPEYKDIPMGEEVLYVPKSIDRDTILNHLKEHPEDATNTIAQLKSVGSFIIPRGETAHEKNALTETKRSNLAKEGIQRDRVMVEKNKESRLANTEKGPTVNNYKTLADGIATASKDGKQMTGADKQAYGDAAKMLGYNLIEKVDKGIFSDKYSYDLAPVQAPTIQNIGVMPKMAPKVAQPAAVPTQRQKNTNTSALLAEANKAIAAGADPEQVKKRLKDNYGVTVK